MRKKIPKKELDKLTLALARAIKRARADAKRNNEPISVFHDFASEIASELLSYQGFNYKSFLRACGVIK